jgi:tetratricopeptide (TPR) repeat protein
LTEDIITDLSHFHDLDVIARNSTAAHKRQGLDAREIGKEFGVRYVLEGSLQRQVDQIRVTAQLIDTTTGGHVWSKRWDRPTTDIFAVQGEIAEEVAAKLGGAFGFGTITAAEVQRAKRRAPTDLTAYEHYLLAAEAKSLRSPEKGFDHAERAVALDPNFARAYTARGWMRYFRIASSSDPIDWKREMQLVGEDFRRGVSLDPADAEVTTALGVYLLQMGELAEAALQFDKALALSPGNVHVLAVIAGSWPYIGKTDDAVILADRALRLDPHMPPVTLSALTDPYFFGHRYEKVIQIITATPEESRGLWTRLLLAASYAMTGEADRATAAKADFIAKHGVRSAEMMINQGFVFARSVEQDQFVDIFRKLGLPVCTTAEQLAKLKDPKRLAKCVKA